MPVDPVKLALEKAKAYQKSRETKPSVEPLQKLDGGAATDSGASTCTAPSPPGGGGGDGAEKVPDAVKIAMEKAKDYRKNKGTC